MALTIILCCFCYIISLMNTGKCSKTPPDVYYLDDKMGFQEKQKIISLSEDLFKDSLLKMRQLVEIREEHANTVAYSVGMIMGRIREKYRFMLETYRDIMVSYYGYFLPRPPGIKYFYSFHFIIALEMMHYLELEIDKLADVIIEEAHDDYSFGRHIAGELEKERERKKKLANVTNMTGRVPPGLRRGGVNRLMEEAEKSSMRQRFLMRKLGYPINMTTMKKRFIRRWPVEDSWSLDKYYHDYK